MQVIQKTPYKVLFTGTLQECQSFLHFHIRQRTRAFLDNSAMRTRFTSECYKVPYQEVTQEQLDSHETFNYTYSHFEVFFTLKEEETNHVASPEDSIM